MSLSTVYALLLVGGFAIQPPGQFHAGEPVAHDGESWLALHVDADRAALVASTLEVRAVHDAMVDEADARTGLLVSSRDDDRVVLYLRGQGLRPGSIEAAAVLSKDPGSAGLPYELTFRGQVFRLSSQCEPQPQAVQGQPLQFDCRIELRTRDRVQVLSRLGGYREHAAANLSLGDDASPELIYAGDLDRDGKLDLIFNATDHYNVSRPVLFLSSPAEAGKLLHEVARYESVGC